MNDLFQDIWHDLMRKRLLPVAALLLVGIVAIPAVMMKSSQTPAASPVTAEAPTAAEQTEPRIEVTDLTGNGAGSSLDTLREKNPFNPPAAIARAGDSAGSPTDGGSATAGADSEGAGEAGGGQGGSTGGTTGGDGGDGNQPAPDSAPAPEPTTTSYEYVADVTFWNGNKRRTIRGLRKLEMLPNQAAPVLIFMGTGPKGGNAVFLVDSTLKAAGEGRCKPAPANCAFVHIGPGSEHAFTTDDGDSYRLRIDEIRRVKVGDRATKASRAGTGRADAVASVEDPRRFSLPTLIDLVEVTAIEHADEDEGDGADAAADDGADDRDAAEDHATTDDDSDVR